MSTLGPESRSFAPITQADLHRLRLLAAADRADFFARHPDWAACYADRVLLVALCQGAALHYLHGKVGVHDFDVYTFYAAHPDRRWPARRRARYDFGDSAFGSAPDQPNYIGRRVDMMGRSLPVAPDVDPVAAVQTYLRSGQTATARFLAQKAVVALEPVAWIGRVVWPSGDGGE